VQFVQRLPHQAASQILEAVVTAFGIPRFVSERSQLEDSSENGNDLPRLPALSRAAQTPRPKIDLRGSSQLWVPEAFMPGLSAVQSVLLIQALMLRRAPGVARMAAFQADLSQWHESVRSMPATAQHSTSEVQLASRSMQKQKATLFEGKEKSSTEQAMIDPISLPAALQCQRSEQAEAEVESGATPLVDVSKDHGKRRRGLASDPQSMPATGELTVATHQAQPHAVHGQKVLLMQELASQAAVLSEDSPLKKVLEPSISVETKYGGVFFLLPLALYLYIYGDFTSPAKPGLELSIWDFLALISLELTNREIEKDPLWGELASLAGRTTSQQPGRGFDPPDEWRIPPDWLEPFSEVYDARPTLANGRLITMHPAGFTVLDIADTVNESCDLEAVGEPVDRLQRWVGWMASYFRARLLRALGRDDAVALLCGRPAHVVLTLTHVDVTFSLDHHPIEIRMSGLDRDPGWIPAAGRYVSFHFR